VVGNQLLTGGSSNPVAQPRAPFAVAKRVLPKSERRRILPTASSKLSNHVLLIKRIIAERKEDDVVVRMQSSVGCRRSLRRRKAVARRNDRGAGEQIECHVLVLQADAGAAEIALVDILPEANREFLDTLHIGRADAGASVKAGGVG